MAESFARVETKYMLSPDQAAYLEERLRKRGFERSFFGSPTVQSLYYDTPDHLLIRQSLERPAYKEKLRLRAYGEPGCLTRSFVEIKKKYQGVVYKRRVALPLRTAMTGLQSGIFPAETGQVGREAMWMVRHYGLIPAAVVSYDRDAWFSAEEENVRITFDRNLLFRTWDPDLNRKTDNLPLTDSASRLMEIKTPGTCPLWLTRLLEETGAMRIHFSKYGLGYRKYILQDGKGTGRSEWKCSTASLLMGA